MEWRCLLNNLDKTNLNSLKNDKDFIHLWFYRLILLHKWYIKTMWYMLKMQKLATKLWNFAHRLAYVPCFFFFVLFKNKCQNSDNIIISNISAHDFNEQVHGPGRIK